MTQQRVGWNALLRWISFDLWTLALRSRLCRWSSVGRMAQSTSSEDGSPTARDLARLPVNTGSVSGSGVRLCLCVCVFAVCVTHARDVYCVLWYRGKPNSGEQIFTQLWSTSCGFIMQLGGKKGSPYQQHNESDNDMNSQVEHSNSKQKAERMTHREWNS